VKNQTGNKFWNHITKKYMLAIPNPLRTPVGLKSRWCALQAVINKFSACVKQIKNQNQSGAGLKSRFPNMIGVPFLPDQSSTSVGISVFQVPNTRKCRKLTQKAG
jgi:hypothetical protein